VEPLDPLAVEDVGLAARHALQLPRVHEPDLEAARAEKLEEGDPVHARGLHRHGLDVAAGEPVGQGVQIRGEGPELSHVAPLGVATVGDGDVVTPGADIDARGVQVDPAEFGRERGRAATAMRLRMGARHGGLLASGHRRGHVGRGGAAVRIPPNGITPQGQAVTNDIGALLRDHAMKRTPRTTEGTVFSTRHVRVPYLGIPQNRPFSRILTRAMLHHHSRTGRRAAPAFSTSSGTPPHCEGGKAKVIGWVIRHAW
jgi:hypothetical protein